MADPLLENNYPVKGLYQALAVAAMCLQEEADTRPLISDVVTALDFLAKKRVEGDDQGPLTNETSASHSPGEDDSGDNESDVVNDDDDDDDNNDDDEEDSGDDDDDDDNDDDHDDKRG